MSIRCGLENALHDIFEDAAVFLLGLAQRFLGAEMAGHRPLQFDEIAPQFQLHGHLVAKDPQCLDLLRSQLSRFAVQHAQRSDGKSSDRCQQRHAGVKADLRIAGHKGVPGKTRVRLRVGQDKQVRLRNADPRLEPVALFVHQTHQRDWGVAGLRREPRQIVEGLFRRRVEDVIGAQRLEPIDFVGGSRCCFHG